MWLGAGGLICVGRAPTPALVAEPRLRTCGCGGAGVAHAAAQEYQRLVDIVPLSKFEANERQAAINKLADEYTKHCCAVVKRLVQARGSGGALKVGPIPA